MATFYHRFLESARKFPHNIALEIQRAQTVERVTFAELSHMAESVGKWLSGRVPPDARVAILAANHPRWVAAYLGIFVGTSGGASGHGFSWGSGRKLLLDSEASLLFCDAQHLGVALEAVERTDAGMVMTSAADEVMAALDGGEAGLGERRQE